MLDTGAMYRAVTLAALERQVPLDDAEACARIAAEHTIAVDDGTTMLDGRDVSAEIRGPERDRRGVDGLRAPAVRTVLVARQRAWVAEHGGGVVEGRDIGTVVFPDAPVKVFLTASDERARPAPPTRRSRGGTVGRGRGRADRARPPRRARQRAGPCRRCVRPTTRS